MTIPDPIEQIRQLGKDDPLFITSTILADVDPIGSISIVLNLSGLMQSGKKAKIERTIDGAEILFSRLASRFVEPLIRRDRERVAGLQRRQHLLPAEDVRGRRVAPVGTSDHPDHQHDRERQHDHENEDCHPFQNRRQRAGRAGRGDVRVAMRGKEPLQESADCLERTLEPVLHGRRELIRILREVSFLPESPGLIAGPLEDLLQLRVGIVCLGRRLVRGARSALPEELPWQS